MSKIIVANVFVLSNGKKITTLKNTTIKIVRQDVGKLKNGTMVYKTNGSAWAYNVNP